MSMLYFKRIISIARYETIMLLRTWKFWILAVVGMFLPVMFNVVVVILRYIGEGPGEFRMLGTLPYLLFYFYNYSLAVIVIFLTSDFREKDRRYRIDGVLYSHCLSNTQLIWGKYLGIVIPLVVLNLIVIALSVIANLLALKTFYILPYFSNFALLTLPSLLFIIPFIIFISSVVRNSAAVFIVVAVYLCISMWILIKHAFPYNQMYYLLDFGCFLLPLFPSDIIGIADMNFSVMQRLFYVILGIFFLEMSILIYPRKEQARVGKWFTVLFCAGSIVCAFLVFNYFKIQEDQRRTVLSEELGSGEKFGHIAGLPIINYNLDITLKPDRSQLQAKGVITVPSVADKDSLTFSLNRGLKIKELKNDKGDPVFFHREGSAVILKADVFDDSKSKNKLFIEYSGRVDSKVEYLLRKNNDKGMIDKYDGPWRKENVTSFISRKSTFLLPTSLWYPQTGVRYGSNYPEKQQISFATSQMTFHVPGDMSVISQGELTNDSEEQGSRTLVYESNVPVPKFSLLAGTYKAVKDTINDIIFRYYYFPDHSYNIDFFAEAGEDIKELVGEIFDIIEDKSGIKYPYRELNFVEVPLQFQWYGENSLMKNEISQPGVILVREELASYQFKENFDREKRRTRRKGEDKSNRELKKKIFTNFLVNRIFSFRLWSEDRFAVPLQDFWTHRINTTGKGYPLLDYYFQEFFVGWLRADLRTKLYPDNKDKKREFSFSGISSWESRRYLNMEIDSVYAAMENTALTEIIPDNKSLKFHAVYLLKGMKLIYSIEEYLGEEDFKKLMSSVVNNYQGKDLTIANFINTAESISGKNLDWVYEGWIKGTALPGFVLLRAEAYKVKTRDTKLEYLVEAVIENSEKDEGFVKLILNPDKNPIVRRFLLKGGEVKKVGLLTTAVPKKIHIDPIFSRNTEIISKNLKIEKRAIARSDVWEGIKDYSVIKTLEKKIIVDDVDEGFSTVNNQESKYLRPGKNRMGWRSEDWWGYGKYKESFTRKEKGDGNNPALWECTIPESGYYRVSVYMTKFTRGWYYRWFTRYVADSFDYNISFEGGEEKVTMSWKGMSDGWNELGSFYFKKGFRAKVSLPDKPDGWVIADAVKWSMTQSQAVSSK